VFTGIVAGRGKVVEIRKQCSTLQAKIVTSLNYINRIAVGDSIAVNGVCLTVVDCSYKDNFYFWVDIIPETQKITNLNYLKNNDNVNIEPPLCWGGKISGHLLSGHVSTTASISEHKFSTYDSEVVFLIDKLWKKYLFKKSYIAIDGVSLTIVDIEEYKDSVLFSVHLIAETQRQTIFPLKLTGDLVNIEFNTMTKTIVDALPSVVAELVNNK
jgi:riboflavin synthase